MTNRNRPTSTLLACLAATSLLTACTNSPEAGRPNGTPTTSTTASASSTGAPTPTATPSAPPARPPAAQGLTLAAAEQFVHYYSDLMNYASDTGDTAPLMSASDAGCENCKAYADFVKKSNAANGLLTGDYHEDLTEVSELVRGQAGRLGGSANVSIGAYVSRETASAAPVSSKATKYTREFALSQQGGDWVMYEMKLVKQ
ncbi:hypothetical protein EV646_11223 [Kribbella antiqua]|uniref:DUF6318 domain-containing protein n=1 Tax=Kribbella antiqua TaxID=2512217 RepID=A0A4R2IGC5_9ACTN|nr:DUF6318 family protein [Kribbella antiqua]TCO43447.1 hypothetical protein EV646_11223 [Kribbella antiqua]